MGWRGCSASAGLYYEPMAQHQYQVASRSTVHMRERNWAYEWIASFHRAINMVAPMAICIWMVYD
jgi:hypothetical protein